VSRAGWRLLLVPLVVLATGSCSSGHEGGPGAAAADEAACTPPQVAPDGPPTRRAGDADRSYLLAVPDDAPPAGGFPLVVSLHGHGSSGVEHEANTGLAAAGRARGAVVATPDGLGDPARWNFDRRVDGPDDYTFVTGLIDELVRTACVDPARVFLAGSSNGAAFAGFLACTGDVDVAAVAMVIATVPPTCHPDRRPSALTIRGTADATVAYAGSEDMVAEWADHDGCGATARTDEPSSGVTRTSYTDCPDGRRAEHIAIADGIHAWPGTPAAAGNPANSPAGATFPATDTVLAFFDRVDPLA
jgi:polyhydroxybutyrate depolymerase